MGINKLHFDPDSVISIMREVAAAQIMPRYRCLAEGDWREKSPGDIVTIADERAEEALTPLLNRLLPGSIVVGEESAARDPSLLLHLSGDTPAWIVDPIDGTANFAAGKPDFCIMIALARKDALVASWIYAPVTGVTAMAVSGAEVKLTGGDAIFSAPGAAHDIAGVIAVGQRGGPELVARAQALRKHARQVKSLRCAGLDYLRLARGEIDFTLFSGVMPWDHAPGIALLRELGGRATYADGKDYVPSEAASAKGVLAARDDRTWRQVYTHLHPEDCALAAKSEEAER